jgi:hypothetical protein
VQPVTSRLSSVSQSEEAVRRAAPLSVVTKIREVAIEYYRLTGKPLGVTGEIAEYEAATILGLELCDAREAGYDARRIGDGRVERLQVKGRSFQGKPNPGERVGTINFRHEWDATLLVLMNAGFVPTAIYEAPRAKLQAVLERPGSKARTERGQMSISQFKAVSRLVWERSRGLVPREGRPVT